MEIGEIISGFLFALPLHHHQMILWQFAASVCFVL